MWTIPKPQRSECLAIASRHEFMDRDPRARILLKDYFEHMADTAINVDCGHSIVVVDRLTTYSPNGNSGYISGGRSSWADMAEANCVLTGLRNPFDCSKDGTIMFSACMMLKLALMKSLAWDSLSFSDWDVAAKVSLAQLLEYVKGASEAA
ncbi:hypothetical protein LTS15_010414 [Exophiala xenobiotica]|nr:hypothetical protein LTS15_010414 [Exophiala xenobiotica]